MKKMRNALVLLAACMMCSLDVAAQREPGSVAVYPRVGLNLSKLSGDAVFTGMGSDSHQLNARNKMGLSAGAELLWQASENYGLTLGMFYSNQGTAFKDFVEYLPTEGNASKDAWRDYEEHMHFHIDLHYLQVPLMVRTWLTDGLSVGVGLQAGYLLSARSTVKTATHAISGNEIINTERRESGSITPLFNRLDLSIPVGVAYEYENYSLDLRYLWGLKRTYKHDFAPKNSSLMLTIGYRINII